MQNLSLQQILSLIFSTSTASHISNKPKKHILIEIDLMSTINGPKLWRYDQNMIIHLHVKLKWVLAGPSPKNCCKNNFLQEISTVLQGKENICLKVCIGWRNFLKRTCREHAYLKKLSLAELMKVILKKCARKRNLSYSKVHMKDLIGQKRST